MKLGLAPHALLTILLVACARDEAGVPRGPDEAKTPAPPAGEAPRLRPRPRPTRRPRPSLHQRPSR